METAKILREVDRVPQPWRNGGGFTTEVTGEPHNPAIDNFLWRVSIATVEGDSDFSVFPGIDRHLMPLSRDGLTLDFGESAEHIPQYSAWGFAGELRVRAVGVSETSLDLNLMARRGTVRGTLVSERVDKRITVAVRPQETVVAIVVDGRFKLGDNRAGKARTLAPMDALEVYEETTLAGEGTIAIARIRLA